ncbi:MAG TPA: SRPBCC domain-containing protein [Chthoniobacterales bacterium]|nr:SRPBCC domain-containing protein [Chthoniobacterales bacterium]
MPKKTSKASVTAATHRLTLEIAKPHAAVWKAFTRDVHLWWPKDFYATESPRRIVFEVKPGGRLYEDAGDGNGLVWYHVLAVDAPNAITMSGFIAPPFGGPATSLLRAEFTAQGEATTVMKVCDSTFGCLGDTSTTKEGWRMLFEGGFKAWVEKR